MVYFVEEIHSVHSLSATDFVCAAANKDERNQNTQTQQVQPHQALGFLAHYVHVCEK